MLVPVQVGIKMETEIFVLIYMFQHFTIYANICLFRYSLALPGTKASPFDLDDIQVEFMKWWPFCNTCKFLCTCLPDLVSVIAGKQQECVISIEEQIGIAN